MPEIKSVQDFQTSHEIKTNSMQIMSSCLLNKVMSKSSQSDEKEEATGGWHSECKT